MAVSYANTWIYKRTHKGDPNRSGFFGCNDCMKTMRGHNYDSVIGVGGKNPDKGDEDISFKINWIGLDPSKRKEAGKKGPQVTFKHFRLYEEKGPNLKAVAPKLFRYMFEAKHVRSVKSQSLPDNIQKEITKVLRLAGKCSKSKGTSSRKEYRGKCK